MKKISLIIGLAIAASVTSINAQTTTIPVTVPTNVPLSVVASAINQTALGIAQRQVYAASLTDLQAAFPELASSTNLAASRAYALAALRQNATNVTAINAIIAALPYPTNRVAPYYGNGFVPHP